MRRAPGDRLLPVAGLAALLLGFASLALLLADIISDGASRLSWSFLTSYPSRRASAAGIYPALLGSIYLIVLTALLAVPVGVAAAVHLEEYGHRIRLARVIELNIANLAAIPSIIYGLLGLAAFVRALNFDRSLLAGAATLALLILPVIIVTSREALRAVPRSLREGSLALGATRWQTIWHQVLPAALPNVATGIILSLSRAMGEAAPLIAIGALTYVPFVPDSLWSPFTAVPIQAFNWISRPQPEFARNAAGAILVLLVVLLAMNAAAVWVRDRFQRRIA